MCSEINYNDNDFIVRLLDWKEKKATNIKPKHNKIVIFKNLFDPKEFDVRRIQYTVAAVV